MFRQNLDIIRIEWMEYLSRAQTEMLRQQMKIKIFRMARMFLFRQQMKVKIFKIVKCSGKRRQLLSGAGSRSWGCEVHCRGDPQVIVMMVMLMVMVMVMVMMVRAGNVSKHDASKGILIWSQPLCLAHQLIIDSIYSIHPFRVLRLCPPTLNNFLGPRGPLRVSVCVNVSVRSKI